MSLKDQFNGKYSAQRDNEYVLGLYYKGRGGDTYIAVDFMTRTMATRTGYGDSGVAVIPFSQLDRDMLVTMHDTLVELGGTPPALPEEPAATPARKFNL